jgi:hypothetical protein
MRILLAISVVGILLPGVARGQQNPEGTTLGVAVSPRVEMQELKAAAPSSSSLQQTTPAAPRPVPTRRRRGSMVGYVEDATIESKVRLRFDTAFHDTAPDRAEFFYAKCGCYSGLPANDPAFDPDAPGPRPGAADDVNFRQLFLEGEYAVDPRVSIFGQIPIRWLLPQSFIPGTGGSFPNQTGFGDVRVGVKLGAVDSDVAAVTAKAQLYLPTGDAAKGLGTDHASVEPAVLFQQQLSNTVTLESQVGIWLPIGGAAPVPTHADGNFSGTVLFYGSGPSFTVYETERVRFAPVIELVGWRVRDGNQTAAEGSDASGINIVNLKIGARAIFGQGSVYAGYGRALTDHTWYDDIFRFEYRHTF